MLKEQNPELDVAIVEADICGAGASGRNGGCALSWSAKYFTLERLFGTQEAIRLVQESEQSIYAIGRFCDKYAVDAEYRLDGTLYTATNRDRLHRRGDRRAGTQRYQLVFQMCVARCTTPGWLDPPP